MSISIGVISLRWVKMFVVLCTFPFVVVCSLYLHCVQGEGDVFEFLSILLFSGEEFGGAGLIFVGVMRFCCCTIV